MDVSFLVYELLLEVVHKGGLLVCIRSLSFDVIEENGKCPYSKAVHALQLLYGSLSVCVVPADIHSGMQCPDEVHFIPPGFYYQPADVVRLFFRIGYAP